MPQEISVANERCRVCGRVFPVEPLLHYENMPAAAQFLPDADSLQSDRGIELKVYQCPACGLVQLNNDPVSYYKEVIRAAAFSEEMRGFRKQQFSAFLQKYSLHGKKLVEIGCGRGEYLSLLQECGADTYGLEYSAESVASCVGNGLRVSREFIETADYKLQDAPFDSFVVLNFLEHWPNPNASLAGICNNLSDDAVGLVEVPNFDMILRNNLFSEFTSDHLFYFTRQTLVATLALNGFDVIECSEVWHNYIISAVVQKRKKVDVSFFETSLKKIKEEIADYVARHERGGVAVWGAGHQALAMISLMDLGGKIKFVVDSATFKQNKFTPATHVPILPPNTLKSNPVQAVIVMAASYSDEVVRTILERFDNTIDVAVLRDFGLETVTVSKSQRSTRE
jgi:SAM-dependent methyltransferase